MDTARQILCRGPSSMCLGGENLWFCALLRLRRRLLFGGMATTRHVSLAPGNNCSGFERNCRLGSPRRTGGSPQPAEYHRSTFSSTCAMPPATLPHPAPWQTDTEQQRRALQTSWGMCGVELVSQYFCALLQTPTTRPDLRQERQPKTCLLFF